ncbi:MAG: dihydrofolate reductase family protein [Desertimonas sp.]
MRALTYLVATTVDGFIADPDGGFGAFPVVGDHIEMLIDQYPDTLPAPARAVLGIDAPNPTFDTVVMGWNTYAAGLPDVTDPYPHLRQFVFSRSRTSRDVPEGIVVTADRPVDVVQALKAAPSEKDIWLCGGGQLATALLPEIDRLVVKVNPLVFGVGIPMFAGAGYRDRQFVLTSSSAFTSGVVVNTYDRAQ